MGTPQCRPGGHSPIKPRRPVRRARQAAKHSNKPHNTAGTVMENQPAGRSRSMTLSRYVRLALLVNVTPGFTIVKYLLDWDAR